MRKVLFAAVAALGMLSIWTSARSTEQAAPAAAASLDGTWDLVAIVEDGKFVPNDTVRSSFFKDGKLIINGSLARFTRPDGRERTLPFVLDTTASPKTLDLAGTEKVGTHGIFMLDGDNLVICFKESNKESRPTSFSAAAGSGAVLLTFRRAGPTVRLEAPAPVVAKPADPEAAVRKSLIGRWGHQNDEVVKYITVNEDGTFSALTRWKKGMKKIFDHEDRASGTWKLENGNVVYTYTASTEKGQVGQIHSLRIVSISSGELIYVDSESGSRRIEWKLP